MKNYEVFLLLILLNATASYFLNRNPNNNQKYLNEYYNDDFGNINKLVESFKMLKKKESDDYFDNFEKNLNYQPSSFRFKQKQKQLISSANSLPSFSDELILSTGNPDLTDDFSFDALQDKELQRKEGISNGQVLYQGKRIANVETVDFKNLFYDLIE